MSEILKFACSAPNCGRKFNTQEKLNTHFNLRHPEIKKEKEKENKPSIEKIMKQISKPKLNPQDKHHFLQPITKRKSMSKIVTTNNKENKEDKNKKDIEEDIDLQNIPSFQEEKEKRLLNNLFGQINNLENYMEKDCEFHKEFKLPEVPDYDNMYDSDNENNNINNKNNKDKENNKNNNNIKNEKDKIYEITEEMILNNSKSINTKNNDENDIDNKYKNIRELNLSKKNIKIFKNKKNISFEKLQELYILNLSENLISEAKDISYFENLRELYLNNNKLEDISFCEFLPNLTILNVENNNIINITSLNICIKLTILKLSNNNIKYLNSTLRIFKNLKNLKETTINSNPFLSELKSYFEYFITNYKNIQKLDEVIITEEKRKKAEIFYKENNPLYKNITERPMSSRPDMNKINKNNNEENNIYNLFEDNSDDEINDDINENLMAKTQINFSNKEKININNNNNNNIEEDKENKNNDINKKEEEKLKKIIEEQNNIINKLRQELDNSSRLNKQYEIQIEQYNNELINIQNNNNKKEDSETEKIKKEIENWKKQYFDLLEKNMNKEETKLKFSKDLFNDKNKRGEKNLIKKDIIERPQTAQVRSNLTKDFKKLYEEINILEGNKNKNIFEDVLNEETDEEEEEEEKEEKEEKNEKEELEEEIPDDEIEEMFRKSYQDIQKMRKDLQEINKNMDNDNNLNKKNNIENILNEDRKGNKPSLKPIIYKKDDNKNRIGNQVFSKHGNIITGNNKNINENNKNSQTQRYNALLYKLKK